MRGRIISGGAIADVTPLGNGDLDRFYFGHAVADGLTAVTSAGQTYAVVNTADQNDPKADSHTTFTRANIEDRNDYNKDSLVNTVDQNAPKSATTTTFTALQLTGSVAP